MIVGINFICHIIYDYLSGCCGARDFGSDWEANKIAEDERVDTERRRLIRSDADIQKAVDQWYNLTLADRW